MKIIINYSPPGSTSKVYKTELTSSNPKETWGQLTQRFIEHSSLHPPQLLSLLKSLNHGGSAKNKYQLRYGNGYATNCNTTWNASSRGSAAGGEDDEMIEANITLKPLAGSPLANTSLGKVSDISMLVIADSVPTKVKSAALEISVELVGLPNPNSDIKMTQAPFPIDMEKVNVLDIVEHGRFEGVVDQYSLKKFNESGQVVGGGAATPMSSGKKRKEVQVHLLLQVLLPKRQVLPLLQHRQQRRRRRIRIRLLQQHQVRNKRLPRILRMMGKMVVQRRLLKSLARPL